MKSRAKQLFFALVAWPLLALAEAPLIEFVNNGATRWECVEVIEGEDILISNHVAQEKALACAATNTVLHPDREFRAVSKQRIRVIINSEAQAQIYFRVQSPDVPQQEESFTRYTIDAGVLTFDAGSNTVTESGGVFTLAIAGGEVFNADDYVDALGFTIPSANDFVLIARVTADSCSAGCTIQKVGWMLRDDIAAPGSQMYTWWRGDVGLRHTIRSTLDGNVFHDAPNPSNDPQPRPSWLMMRGDRAIPSIKTYHYPFGSDPGTDPDVNWIFSRELTDADFGTSWVDSGDIFALLVSTPDDGGDAGHTSSATIDNVSVTFPALDHAAPAPPAVDLSAASYSVDEDAGTVTLTIIRTGSGAGALAVDYVTSDGTGVAGIDYTAKSGQCNWVDAETGTCATADAGDEFTVTITDRDGVTQGNTEFTGTISINSGADALGISTATVTIVDKDETDPQAPGFPAQTCTYDAVLPGICSFGADWGDLSAVTWEFCEVATPTKAALEACIDDDPSPNYRLTYFSTSGEIDIGTRIDITGSNHYIAGQTAPSPGITLRGNRLLISCNLNAACDNIAIAHIGIFGKVLTNAWNLGDIYDIDHNSGAPGTDFLIINPAAYWSSDENVQALDHTGIGFFQGVIAEPMRFPGRPDAPHDFNVLLRSTSDVSMQRNVFAHATGRNPRSKMDDADFSNNVTYNARVHVDIAEGNNDTESNVEGNLFISGPGSSGQKPIRTSQSTAGSEIYVADNCAVGYTDDTQDDMVNGGNIVGARLANAHPAGLVVEGIAGCGAQNEIDFANLVMDCAGPRPSERAGDAADQITETLDNITARLTGVGDQGDYVDDVDVSAITFTIAENTVDHTVTACPGGTTIPTADPNGTGAGIYIVKALNWAACHHENVTPPKCGQVRP